MQSDDCKHFCQNYVYGDFGTLIENSVFLNDLLSDFSPHMLIISFSCFVFAFVKYYFVLDDSYFVMSLLTNYNVSCA